MISINQKIAGYSVVTSEEKPPKPVLPEREPVLHGSTFKIKTPLSESALYVTINDCDGKPFEIFINSKDTRHFQWVTALTRVMSAVFRQGGDCTFLIEELRSIFDPTGGYFKKGKFVPSLVAEIGDVLEQHLTSLGLYQKDESLAKAAQQMIEEKIGSKSTTDQNKGSLCAKCGEYSVVMLDNCYTCLSCGSSSCG